MKAKEIIAQIKNLSSKERLDVLNAITGMEETEEQIGVKYAADAFKDIETLRDFQEKYREVDSRRMNFMKPMGLSSLFN